MLIWNSIFTLNLNIYLYSYKTQTAIFIATNMELCYKAWKSNYGSYSNLSKYFFRFEPLASNTIKNETGKKLKKITWNKFSKVFIRIPGTLAHKTSRLYTHSSILCQEKFCATRKLVHRILWLHTSSIICLFISGQLKLITNF